MRKLVSIIAPMFNGETYIERFIRCIQKQTYDNWELIIVDDGSEDNSTEIVRNIEKSDSRIKLRIRTESPKGSVTCRNIGQKEIKGDYFIHLDSDDIVQSNMIEQRLRFMETHTDIDYATSRAESVTVENDLIIHTGRYWGDDPHQDLLSCFLKVQYPFSVWNNIYRTSTMGKCYWDNEVRIYTDFSYIVPSIVAEYKHAFIDNCDVDYYYVVGQKSAMTSSFISKEKYKSTKRLFKNILNLLENTKNPVKYKKDFKRFFNLQLERVSINGSQDQIDDFYDFYRTSYENVPNIRLRLLYNMVLCKAKANQYSSRRIRLSIYLFLNPANIIQAIKGKVRS